RSSVSEDAAEASASFDCDAQNSPRGDYCTFDGCSDCNSDKQLTNSRAFGEFAASKEFQDTSKDQQTRHPTSPSREPSTLVDHSLQPSMNIDIGESDASEESDSINSNLHESLQKKQIEAAQRR